MLKVKNFPINVKNFPMKVKKFPMKKVKKFKQCINYFNEYKK